MVFGVLSATVFGGGANGDGLRDTFVLAVVVLFAAAIIVLMVGRRTYPQDVAAAARSVELTAGAS